MSSAGQRPLDEETARATVKAAFAAVTADDVRVNIDARETGFVRYALGEGIEKGTSDFAAEVAAAGGTT